MHLCSKGLGRLSWSGGKDHEASDVPTAPDTWVFVCGREIRTGRWQRSFLLITSATSTRCVFQKPKPKIENNTADHLVRCCPSEALSNYWKTLAHTSWFKRHPILSATSLTKLLFLGVWNDDENDDEHYGEHDGK